MEEKKNRKPRYFFQLLREGSGETDWRSAGVFASAQEAHTAFGYFRLLLQEARNYFIDYDDTVCGYRIGIREVLAESTGSFATEDEAWGQDGVQRFIGVAQQPGGWHPEKQGARYWGYYVACPNNKALHPCTYENERQRDDVLEHLYAAAQGFPASGWITPSGLVDPVDGHPVAVFAGPGGVPGIDEAGLNLILDVMDAVWAGLFFEDAEGLYVKAGGGQTLIRPVSAGVGRDRWEDELLRYGAYLPMVRTTITGAAAQYQLEIKLPGFAALPGREYSDKACGCPPEKHGEQFNCYAAWISDISYGSAMEVWNVYQALLPLLADKSNYHPVHDESALEYGIELLVEQAILARSIQRYFYATMAARALDRAKDCVNTEGLNVVEHVLLRPDKEAGKIIPVCAAGDNPTLTAPVGANNPTPTVAVGADAYSFLMTVFLPAWPQRFRKTENRQLLESIIQRETPAHILPRILWLTPRDMCRMESNYKKWLHWLNTGSSCGDFKPDDLIELLFSTPFDCMSDVACGQESQKENADEWLSEINKLYCWSDSECADTSSWKTGSGTAVPSNNSPFTMSGTQLPRPALKNKTIEKKPEQPKPPSRCPRSMVINNIR
jgi:hypothetical protein